VLVCEGGIKGFKDCGVLRCPAGVFSGGQGLISLHSKVYTMALHTR
jgi:hypothetical protein